VNQSTPEFVTQSMALAFTAAALFALHARGPTPAPAEQMHDPGVMISLLEEAPAPPAPQVEPPKPVPHTSAARRPAPAPVAAPVTIAADPTPDADAAVMLPAEAAAPPPAAVSHASVEAAYAAALRENVDARTEVPKTAEYRLLKPSGAPQVCFTLDRGGGNPGNVAVTHRSGSTILDAQALRIVAAGHYPPFPEAAFPGEQRHVFVVTIEFRS
jgi:outer membrane biosynthesis protein TonB